MRGTRGLLTEVGSLHLGIPSSVCRRPGTLRARAALRWLQRFIDERLPPPTEVALGAAAPAELRHGNQNVGVEALKRLLHRG